MNKITFAAQSGRHLSRSIQLSGGQRRCACGFRFALNDPFTNKTCQKRRIKDNCHSAMCSCYAVQCSFQIMIVPEQHLNVWYWISKVLDYYYCFYVCALYTNNVKSTPPVERLLFIHFIYSLDCCVFCALKCVCVCDWIFLITHTAACSAWDTQDHCCEMQSICICKLILALRNARFSVVRCMRLDAHTHTTTFKRISKPAQVELYISFILDSNPGPLIPYALCCKLDNAADR